MSATGIDHTKCEQTIRQLRAAADKLAEAAKLMLEDFSEDGAECYCTTEPVRICAVCRTKVALAQHAEMKLASSGGLPTDTGASQGGRE